jgi:hypothetical protein
MAQAAIHRFQNSVRNWEANRSRSTGMSTQTAICETPASASSEPNVLFCTQPESTPHRG